MESVLLKYPVVTIDGKVLVESGTVLTSENINSFLSDNNNCHKTEKILSFKTIKDDLLQNINKDPYNSIITDKEKFNYVISIMESISLPVPVLESLYYFKDNDHHTYIHFLMVFTLTSLLANEIISDKKFLHVNITAGSTHDIGKICIPKEILQKSTPLTKLEKSYLKQHTISGYFLLNYYYGNKYSHIANIARDHHERKDCSGYPFKIKTDNSDLTDIVVICDIFDALISSRPYRPVPYDVRSAVEEITDLAVDKKINWKIIKALVSFLRKNKRHFEECDISREKRGKPPEHNLYGIFSE